MKRMLDRCPVCEGPMRITELSCEACGAQVRSVFEPCRFCRLTPEQLQFVELFLKSRGNITTVGNDLGISYPTVTRRLDAALAALGYAEETEPAFPPPPPPPPMQDDKDLARRGILEMLDRGDITAEEATRRLKEL
jgi:hypothetical protein